MLVFSLLALLGQGCSVLMLECPGSRSESPAEAGRPEKESTRGRKYLSL
jgi:hypothetical protein